MRLMKFLFLFCLLLQAVPASSESLIIMAWDGAGKINVDRLMAEGRLPNLRQFISDSAVYAPLSPNGSTETAAQWTAAFTGLEAAQTGVLAQYDFAGTIDPTDYNNNTGIFVDMRFFLREVPWEDWVFESITAADPARRFGWFIGKRVLQEAAFGAIPPNTDSSSLRAAGPSGPGCVGPADGYIFDLESDALTFMAGGGEYLMLVHTNPDHAGHHCGENSAEYEDDIVRSDDLLGVLRAADPNAKILVLTDHGFDEQGTHPTRNGHPNAPDLWLATDIGIDIAFRHGWPARAEMRDVAITLLDWYGLPWAQRVPQMRGKTLLPPAP